MTDKKLNPAALQWQIELTSRKLEKELFPHIGLSVSDTHSGSVKRLTISIWGENKARIEFEKETALFFIEESRQATSARSRYDESYSWQLYNLIDRLKSDALLSNGKNVFKQFDQYMQQNKASQ